MFFRNIIYHAVKNTHKFIIVLLYFLSNNPKIIQCNNNFRYTLLLSIMIKIVKKCSIPMLRLNL